MNIQKILHELHELDGAGKGVEADRREAELHRALRRLAVDNRDLARLWEQDPAQAPKPQQRITPPGVEKDVVDVPSGVRYIFDKIQKQGRDPWERRPSNNYYVVSKPDGGFAVVHTMHMGGKDLPAGWKLLYDHRGQGI